MRIDDGLEGVEPCRRPPAEHPSEVFSWVNWWPARRDSNPRPTDPKSVPVALGIALRTYRQCECVHCVPLKRMVSGVQVGVSRGRSAIGFQPPFGKLGVCKGPSRPCRSTQGSRPSASPGGLSCSSRRTRSQAVRMRSWSAARASMWRPGGGCGSTLSIFEPLGPTRSSRNGSSSTRRGTCPGRTVDLSPGGSTKTRSELVSGSSPRQGAGRAGVNGSIRSLISPWKRCSTKPESRTARLA
jgi:hypothetical protein